MADAGRIGKGPDAFYLCGYVVIGRGNDRCSAEIRVRSGVVALTGAAQNRSFSTPRDAPG